MEQFRSIHNTSVGSWKYNAAKSVEATTKKGGKVAANIKIVVAKDGKSMTVSSKGKNAKGEASSSEVVYDRQ